MLTHLCRCSIIQINRPIHQKLCSNLRCYKVLFMTANYVLIYLLDIIYEILIKNGVYSQQSRDGCTWGVYNFNFIGKTYMNICCVCIPPYTLIMTGYFVIGKNLYTTIVPNTVYICTCTLVPTNSLHPRFAIYGRNFL